MLLTSFLFALPLTTTLPISKVDTLPAKENKHLARDIAIGAAVATGVVLAASTGHHYYNSGRASLVNSLKSSPKNIKKMAVDTATGIRHSIYKSDRSWSTYFKGFLPQNWKVWTLFKGKKAVPLVQ